MLYHWYVTPENIAMISKNKASDRCWKCGEAKGTFHDMWWLCPKVKKFWDMVYTELRKIFKINLLKSPELLLLGLKLENIDSKDRTALWYLHCKTVETKYKPKKEDWIVSFSQIIEMDKLTRRLRQQDQQEFLNCWNKVKLYMRKKWANTKNLRVSEWMNE